MGLHKSPSTHRSEESLRTQSYPERHEKICPYLSQSNRSKNNVNLKTKSEPALKQLRSTNRQKKRIGPKRKQQPQKQSDEVPTPREIEDFKETISGNQRFNHGDADTNRTNSSEGGPAKDEVFHSEGNESKRDMEEPVITQQTSGLKANQHEYLQFLLRITEDIILNNYFKNEDIVNVFQYHIDANKDRLDMDKMYNHLRTLSNELNIIYKPFEDYKFQSEENDEKQVDLISTSSMQIPLYDGDCECSIKRVLNLEQTGLDSIVDLLMNKRSLDKLTEYTEPTNSVETLCSSSKVTTVSSDGSIKVLGSDEQGTVSEFCIQANFNEGVLKEVKSEGDVAVTKPDVLNSVESTNFGALTVNIQNELNNEDNLDKIVSSNSDIELCQDNSLVNNTEKIFQIDSDLKIVELYTKNSDFKKYVDELQKSNENSSTNLVLESDSKSTLESLEKSNENSIIDLTLKNDNIISSIDLHLKNNTEDNIETPKHTTSKPNINTSEESSTKKDQCTQVIINYSDKDCNTTEDIVINDITESDDYILVNGPVYILKKVFNLDKTVIVTNPVQSEVDYAPMKDTNHKISPENIDNKSELTNQSFTNSQSSIAEMPKILRGKTFIKESINTNLSNYSLGSETSLNPLYLNEKHFYRLLHSDYDITPQRDHSIDKYHYLLVDASTSSPNLDVNNLEDHSLLKSEYYAIENSQADPDKYLKSQ